MPLSWRVLREMLEGINNNSGFTNHLHFVNQPDRGFPHAPPEGMTWSRKTLTNVFVQQYRSLLKGNEFVNNPRYPKKENEIEILGSSTPGRIPVSLMLPSILQLAFPEQSWLLLIGKS